MRKLKLDELNRATVEEFKKAEKTPLRIVLDNIRSAHNVGSIFRTCDGLAIEHLYLCGITAKPPHKEITKAAIGATHSVDWSYHANILQLVENLKADGHLIVGVEQTDSSVDLDKFEFNILKDRKTILILGNEVEGLSDQILPLLDFAIEIPQYGTKHSFNVAVCAGMVMWSFTSYLRNE
ncbi:MAG: RNA methyltransferase [Saprospiraceae bacterium]|nr:RNA methyltransferase [Saprospiraceae bacterium]